MPKRGKQYQTTKKTLRKITKEKARSAIKRMMRAGISAKLAKASIKGWRNDQKSLLKMAADIQRAHSPEGIAETMMAYGGKPEAFVTDLAKKNEYKFDPNAQTHEGKHYFPVASTPDLVLQRGRMIDGIFVPALIDDDKKSNQA